MVPERTGLRRDLSAPRIKSGRFSGRQKRLPCGSLFFALERNYFLLPSHLVTHTEQAMSPVTFRQVRPMSKIRSTATIRPM